jgi:glycosyltransferase involved in cell wall biosynthesis
MKKIVIVLKGYPRLSETFIAQEILGLQEKGVDLHLVSLRHPTDTRTHPVHESITAPVLYLPEYLHREPLRVLEAWWAMRKRKSYREVFSLWLKDLKRDFSRNRIRRFGQALVLAHKMPQGAHWLYAHFLHTPASVTRYAAHLSALPWSCSAHAKDIWTSPDWEKAEKLTDMNWLVTCTALNVEHLRALVPQAPEKVSLVYHGLDFSRFDARTQGYSTRNGRTPDDPVIIISVGRLVIKKGYDTLLEALAKLPPDLNWRFVHIGGGALGKSLEKQAEALGIEARISWQGARPQQDVLRAYREADLFVLASKVADDGDRDGLPNVLMEAQSQGLACISTRVSAIPELIIDGETGMLVPQQDPELLGRALEALITDPALRQKLGAAGGHRVREKFGHEEGIARVARMLDGDAA